MHELSSIASYLSSLPVETRQSYLKRLSPRAAELLLTNWKFWARPKQLPPPEWATGQALTWLILAGRGWGKTRTGAETTREKIETCDEIGLVGTTAADIRDVMIEGPSGLLSTLPADQRKQTRYLKSQRKIEFWNGAIARTYSADRPDQMRGPNLKFVWADELAAWRYPEAWAQLEFTLRAGKRPQVVVTTTPRPTPLVRAIFEDPTTALTHGTSYENKLNLAASWFAKLLKKYEGTRLGRQELMAQLLTDIAGALWQLKQIEDLRISKKPEVKAALDSLYRTVVALDPPITSGEDADEAGIVAAGRTVNGDGYVLEDFSMRGTPAEWGRKALDAARKLHADAIVAEINQGGEMVEHVLRSCLKPDEEMPRIILVHASKAKVTRAEPISALYEQGRIHHLGTFAKLEDQMTTWVPGVTKKSPDRMDALVWAMTDLFPNEFSGPLDGARRDPGMDAYRSPSWSRQTNILGRQKGGFFKR